MHAHLRAQATGALAGLVKSQTPLGGRGDGRPLVFLYVDTGNFLLWKLFHSRSLSFPPLPPLFLPPISRLHILGCSLGSCSLALRGPVFYSWTPLELHGSAEGKVVSIFSWNRSCKLWFWPPKAHQNGT